MKTAESVRIPVATYRLQLSKDFTLYEASHLSSYLKRLGISDVYVSPLLQAKKDSTHCYDAVNHGQINSQIGGLAGLELLSSRLKHNKMGILLDIVPNHMSTDQDNKLWQNVLEFGPTSKYASFFDVYWSDAAKDKVPKIVMPILGDEYARVLRSSQLNLVFDEKEMRPKIELYGSQRLPLAPRSYALLLKDIEKRANTIHIPKKEFEHLDRLRKAFYFLENSNEKSRYQKFRYSSKAESNIRKLGTLYRKSSKFRLSLQATFREFNQTNDLQKRYRKMSELLKLQHYKICYWKSPSAVPNYRRFFYINDLAAIRAEDPWVFSESHRLIFELLSKETISGLRVDHIDGLSDPAEYLRRLQRNYSKIPHKEQETSNCPLYVIVEKILAENEKLPSTWETYGTTGYDFSRDVGGVFVDSENRDKIISTYQEFTGQSKDFRQIAYESKKKIIKRYMGLDISRLSTRLWQISRKIRQYRSLEFEGIRGTLEEVIAHFPVYRTYIDPRRQSVSLQDSNHIRLAISVARNGHAKTSNLALELIHLILISGFRDSKGAAADFVARFQQTTAPIVAKGIEDTAFYRYNPLVSLNEVGGNPEQFGITADEFHSRNRDRLRSLPNGMLNTSTHDSKRSEDARSRISVISEIPSEWESSVREWRMINKSKKVSHLKRKVPSRNDEYLLYQALVGAWPLENLNLPDHSVFVERIVSYMRKATKEAKQDTSWIDPDLQYDKALESFVRKVLNRSDNRHFLDSFLKLFSKIRYFGMLNSLSQLLLKLTSPGTPDIYQGNEIWDFSLVDPDNRKQVDFEKRKGMLNSIISSIRKMGKASLSSKLLANWQDGAVKMYVTHMVLAYRNKHEELFRSGDYVPLYVEGIRRSNLCSFMRSFEGETCIVLAPRLFTGLTETDSPPIGENAWEDTLVECPNNTKRNFRNIITGEPVKVEKFNGSFVIRMSNALERFPVAVLA